MRPIGTGRHRRLIFAGASASLLAVPATAVALTAGPLLPTDDAAKAASSSARRAAPVQRRTARTARTARTTRTARTAADRGCKQLFTVKMGQRAANAIYSGHGRVGDHALKVLGYIERCQRNPGAQGFVRGYDRYQAGAHQARVAAFAAQASAARQAGSGWAIPSSVVQCESGGRDLPPNSAGASGYYQIIPSTWAAYGGTAYAPSAYQASEQEQAVIASRIWDGGAGAGQWVCAGR